MKAYTSRIRFDERRRFTSVQEQMGRVRLDSDANEQALLVRTDARRRSGDLADGSPDDGFLVTNIHLLDPILSTEGWGGQGLPADDLRVIPRELGLARRDPDTLPQVVRVRGYTQVLRTLPQPIDLLHLPIPLHPSAATYEADALILPVRFVRPPTDDEVVGVGVVLLDRDGNPHRVADVNIDDLSDEWASVRAPVSGLDALRMDDELLITGWGFEGLPPRAEIYFDALLAEDAELGEGDLVLRGGNGTLAGAGRLYRNGWRAFLEHDWRYSLQPDLPNPLPLERPDSPDDWHHLVYLDLWERPVHAFQDRFLVEPALDGDDTTFRSRKVAQIRARQIGSGGSEALLGPIGGGRLSTNIASGDFPDRFPPEEFDPCRDRCLFTENASTGEGYRGRDNIHFRVEIFRSGTSPVIVWSRNNAATVAPLVQDGVATSQSVLVDSEDAARFLAGDIVVVEDELSRLDPDRNEHRQVLRRLRAVDTATGRLEFHEAGHLITSDPADLTAGGQLGRAFRVADRAAVRSWDGTDWLLTATRYNLNDGITFAFSGSDFRVGEYWTFAARIANPDGGAHGTVEQLDQEPVHGPRHQRVPLARVRWTATGREFEDLRVRFLPLHHVRDRLIELGRRHLSPGAFTVVVGDGVRTFGDIDQNISEGVTGDEALQAALDRLGQAGGTIYIRAGVYRLEHPVLIQGRSDVRVLGDGDASELRVTGAGGAFFLDRCGQGGDVTVELLDLVESPEEETPFGAEVLVGDLDSAPERAPLDLRAIIEAAPLLPSDLLSAANTAPELVTTFARNLPLDQRGVGRAAASVVRTITRLRRLQRENPGQSLEDIAAEELEVLRRLPHGVLTVTDSTRVSLRRLTIASREQGQDSGIVAAGVLVSGTCSEIEVSDCRIHAPSGVVAAPYGRFLTPQALIQRPRSGLFARSVKMSRNHIRSLGAGSFGVRIADGDFNGVTITDNQIDGFPTGLSIEDRAELRFGEAVDRTVVSNNRVLGASLVGIRVTGDGVDLESNEVRLAPSDASFRAGVQITGVANQVRDNWISLAASSTVQTLGLEAGIVIGSGTAGGWLVQRPVHDLEVTGNRIEGTGGVLGCGILLGGAQPIYDVRVRNNTLRNLGDAGVRAWAYSGAIGRLQIDDNRIEGVARAYRSWGPAVVDQVIAMVPELEGTLTLNFTPRDVLEALLDQDTGDLRPAIDAVLRWVESATLRGGVALSLVEESQVRNNIIVDIGNSNLPSNFVGPGAEIRSAGVALAGGRNLRVEGNRVERVQGARENTVPSEPFPAVPPVLETPVAPTPARPPIFDFLQPLRIAQVDQTPAAQDTYGAVVALRRKIMAYAAGNSRERQVLGGSIYAAMDSVEAALEGHGPEARRLATDLSVGINEMLEAQGAAAHTTAANLVRATLSDAASLTAEDDAISEAWSVAARFDHALLGSDEDVTAAATEIGRNAEMLLQGLDDVGVDLQARAAAVIDAGGSETAQRRARLRLAQSLGTLAEARSRKVSFQKAMPEGGLTARDSTIVEGMVRLSLDSLGGEETSTLNEEEIRRLERGASALSETLASMHYELGENLRQDFQALKEAGPDPGAELIGRVRDTLGRIQAFARNPQQEGTRITAADLEAQDNLHNAELVMLTAEQLDRRVGGLALEVESSSTHNLRLLRTAVGQMVNLVSGQPNLIGKAREVEEAITDAITDVENRAQHQATARQKLRELKEEQEQSAGVGLRKAAEPSAARVEPERLAGLGQLLLELRRTSQTDLRQEGLDLFEGLVRRTTEELDLRSNEREGLLRPVRDASGFLTQNPSAEAEAAAFYSLGNVLDRLSNHAARQPGASRQTKAARVLNGALARGLDPAAEERDRLSGMKHWIEANSEVLAPSVVRSFLAPNLLNDALNAAVTGLTGLTRVRVPATPPVLTLPGLRLHPADGLFAAGVQSHLHFVGNRVESTRLGALTTGREGHVLAPAVDDTGVNLSVEGNLVIGGATGGIDLQPESWAVVSLLNNHVLGSSGLASSDASDYGRSVVRIEGEGELIVAGNRLQDNGANQSRLLHELLVNWRGDLTVQDNWIRHAGGGAGGVGVLLITEDVSPGLVSSLAQNPALEVESAPEPPDQNGTGDRPSLDLNDFVLAGLGERAALLQGKRSFGFGGFQLATRDDRPSFASLEAVQPVTPSFEVAETQAQSWLDLPPRTFINPIHEFLRLVPPRIILPRPRPRRAIRVATNDVVATGPALLLLAQGPDQVSATVVGNEFESSTDTGAVYLRNLDTTVFAANRCECLREVNVVVIRSGRSLVSVTGNAAVGAEPPVPPTPPFPPFAPNVSQFGDLHLAFNLGSGSALTLRLDEKAVLQTIQDNRDTTYRPVAEAAEASFNQFLQSQNLGINPNVIKVFTSGAASRYFVRILGDKLERVQPTGSADVAGPSNPGDPAQAQSFGAVHAPWRAAEVISEALSEQDINEALLASNAILANEELPPSAKLYGMARNTGYTSYQARNFVQWQVAANGGDDRAALGAGLQALTGIEYQGPTVAERASQRNIMEEIISLGLRNKDFVLFPEKQPLPPPAPPPDPRDHSIVIIGGSRVGSVNNVTTAGVHVHNAAQSIENNL